MTAPAQALGLLTWIIVIVVLLVLFGFITIQVRGAPLGL